jgi:hypothetical protein
MVWHKIYGRNRQTDMTTTKMCIYFLLEIDNLITHFARDFFQFFSLQTDKLSHLPYVVPYMFHYQQTKIGQLKILLLY